MEILPSQISGATFAVVRKGFDPEEVKAFLVQAAEALEQAQQQATAMEARARAAVARLQEVNAAAEQSPTEPIDRIEQSGEGDDLKIGHDDAEMISRTLLLAQRTADTAVADAQSDADKIRLSAKTEVEATLDSTREMSAQILEEARSEARGVSEAELKAAENEVQSLVARREFLVGDVDQLERFLTDERDRLRAAARQIEALCDRIPSGLGEASSPALSASDDEPGDDTSEMFRPAVKGNDVADDDPVEEHTDQAANAPE